MRQSTSQSRPHLRRLSRLAALLFAGLFAAPGVHGDLLPVFGRDCQPAFDSRINLTWYGNSWGDFADFPGYGWIGWEPYFEAHQPAADWRIQNLAIGGWTTKQVYDSITFCAKTQSVRESYRTAKNVLLEIGGNDYIQHLPFLIYAPWMYPRIQQRVVSNTEAILVSLRHPRRNKNVLVVGHIPAVTTSPTLGPPSVYFAAGRIQPSISMRGVMDEIREKKEASYPNQQIDEGLRVATDTLGREIPDELGRRIGADGQNVYAAVGLQGLYTGAACPGLEWYCSWLELNESDVGMSSLSLAMLLHNGPLEAVAARNGAEFLPIYQVFAREADCLRGSCWVAKHTLYSDFIHKNYLGYFVYSYHVSRKLTELGWDRIMPENDGLIADPATALPESEEGVIQPVVVQPNNTDLLILFCLFTGACW